MTARPATRTDSTDPSGDPLYDWVTAPWRTLWAQGFLGEVVLVSLWAGLWIGAVVLFGHLR